MGKSKPKIPSIRDIVSHIKGKNFLPVYYFFGEDTGTIDGAIDSLSKAISPLLSSDFDKENISADKSHSINEIIDMASAFPFGDGKKLIVVKNVEQLKERKILAGYAENPPDFTFLILAHFGKINSFESEPLKTLLKHGFLYEAKKLKGYELSSWLVKKAAVLGKELSNENAGALLEIAGEERSFIETQLNKLVDYTGERKEITIDDVKTVSSVGKEYSSFDFLDELGHGNKAKALELGLKLLDSGEEILKLLGLISRFLKLIAHHTELRSIGMTVDQAAKEVGVNPYFYKKTVNKTYFLNDENLRRGAKAVLDAEIALKSTATDDKTVMTILIAEMIK
ncbi:MAG: hypothetical protein SCALA702_29570 [Melioribacteraceae bacterium]|nr:MAG: hypothetical protein SCALA702_29570 [Melioribacteraceae bacterium]